MEKPMDIEEKVAELDTLARAKMMEGYENAMETVAGLFTTISTALVDGERVPDMDTGHYVDTPKTQEWGITISAEKETISPGRKEKFLKSCNECGWKIGYNKAKRILATVLGLTRTFTLDGVTYDTYQPSINEFAGRPLEGIDSLRKALEILEDKGSFLKQIFVLPARLFYARRILQSVRPYLAGLPNDALTSPIAYQLLVHGSDTFAPDFKPLPPSDVNEMWFAGDFQEAFCYMETQPVTVTHIKMDEKECEQGIVGRWKISERGVPAVMNPLKACRFRK